MFENVKDLFLRVDLLDYITFQYSCFITTFYCGWVRDGASVVQGIHDPGREGERESGP